MLELDGITKRYGERVALDGVGFTVGDGRLTGFVGGNGAGKTTTMRIILGVLAADAGTVTLDGSAVTEPDRRRFGYMPEERGLYPKMRVLEQTVYLARLHGWSTAAARRNALELLERLGLGERVNDTIESLSLGNQQRAQIAAALVHRPEVLVLDEPFSGLDPMAVETVQGVLAEFAASGAPVLFSSHQLDIVERLCDDLVIIADGRIRAAGERDALRTQHGSDRWELLMSGDAGWLREAPGIEVIEFDGGWATFEAASDAARQAVLAEALARGEVVSFTREHTTLAQIFKEVVR
ncbi:ABC transporter ATP-binding protein [Agromyces sp. Marseille-P2726]|uniref:ABC transporter ATP-binding protein n=1 Tax=Agromyces sp. Marseille-P2726 TaxID=2709132 RepID=UPI00156E2DE3|nr:ATP-binding cassette domain-containing protein [Agromyces sp. Marseille-P2726]